MHPGGFWSKDYLAGYLPDFEAESGIARGRRNKVRVYRVRNVLFDDKGPVVFPLKAAKVRAGDTLDKVANEIEPLPITSEEAEDDRKRDTAERRKADERDSAWSDEKSEAMKGIEDVPGTGSADDGIVEPDKGKPFSWMDHKIEFVPSTWNPKDRRETIR